MFDLLDDGPKNLGVSPQALRLWASVFVVLAFIGMSLVVGGHKWADPLEWASPLLWLFLALRYWRLAKRCEEPTPLSLQLDKR